MTNAHSNLVPPSSRSTRRKPWRFVVAIDVTDTSLDAAYAQLHVLLARCAWESSDEAYDPTGDPVDDEALASARMRVLAAMPD